MNGPVVELRSVSISFPASKKPVVSNVSFHINAGECLALVGESGSGKTLTALSLLGLTPADARVESLSISVAGVEVSNFSQADWRSLRGTSIGLVSQDALVSLDPLRTVEAEVGEVLEISRPRPTRSEISSSVLKALRRAAVPDPHFRKGQYPHELSGGLRQRALIASAIAAQPRILVADEPTTALDSITGAHIFDLLKSLKDSGLALLLVSHDLGLVRDLADRIAVMRDGEIVELAPTADIFHHPQHPYTRELLAATPSRKPRASTTAESGAEGAIAISCSGVHQSYPGPEGRAVPALHDVSLQVRSGRTLGIVGESGSGKSTLARILMGLEEPDSGVVELEGQRWSPAPEKSRRLRRGHIQLVEQNPDDALDPRWSVGRILDEALKMDTSAGVGSERTTRVVELLERVGLSPVLHSRKPHQLSGGQRQRVAIARALARGPAVLVCDEPVSALDASVQSHILSLLTSLQSSLGLTLIMISHDIGVIAHMSDDIIVMREGRIVETGPRDTVLDHPSHPFTRALLAASRANLS